MISRYDRVEIAPTQTSIYLGSVSMTIPSCERKSGVYESEYTAKVFPFFFYSKRKAEFKNMGDVSALEKQLTLKTKQISDLQVPLFIL